MKKHIGIILLSATLYTLPAGLTYEGIVFSNNYDDCKIKIKKLYQADGKLKAAMAYESAYREILLEIKYGSLEDVKKTLEENIKKYESIITKLQAELEKASKESSKAEALADEAIKTAARKIG